MPLPAKYDDSTLPHRGYAYILYVIPSNAVNAFNALDGTIFQGRLLHILPAEEKKEKKEHDLSMLKGSVQKQREKERRKNGLFDFNWNSLYMNVVKQ